MKASPTMQNNSCRGLLNRKRKLQLVDLAGEDATILTMPVGRLFSPENMRDDRLSQIYLEAYSQDPIENKKQDHSNIENRPPTEYLQTSFNSPTTTTTATAAVVSLHSNSSLCHSPLVVTPERRFEKPTAFISPITRTMKNASETVQVNTPDKKICSRGQTIRGQSQSSKGHRPRSVLIDSKISTPHRKNNGVQRSYTMSTNGKSTSTPSFEFFL